MEANTLPGGMLPGLGSGMLGLEMPLHNPHHQQHHPPPPSHPHHQQQQSYSHHHPHLSMVAFNTHESDPHSQSQQPMKQNNYPFANKPKQQPQQPLQQQQQQLALSDEEEHGFNGEDGGEGRKRVSPWQRVKWTDNMVKLLIMVVFYVGDDNGSEGNESSKKKGGLLQKKGKWKSVSRAMMEKGFYVSPQQCEDKFNDLNKRYKRVNDILGKGIACRVVENQALLESMDQLSPKVKEEVRKLLNSKHLFFREMCAYHTNGGGGGGGGGGERLSAHQVSDVAVEPSTHHQQQQRCFHSSQNNVGNVNLRNRVDTDGLKMSKGGGGGGGVREHEDYEDGEEDDNDEEEDEEEEDDEEEEEIENGGRDCGKGLKLHGGGHEEEDDEYKSPSKKRQRRGGMFSSSLVQQLSCELMNVVQDGSKSPWEQRQWMRSRSLQLEEQRVSYQCQAFELEKQRLKWIKFSGEKEREMERMKLNNERMRLENERMVLLLRQKELELFDHHQQQHSSSKRPEPSSMTG